MRARTLLLLAPAFLATAPSSHALDLEKLQRCVPGFSSLLDICADSSPFPDDEYLDALELGYKRGFDDVYRFVLAQATHLMSNPDYAETALENLTEKAEFYQKSLWPVLPPDSMRHFHKLLYEFLGRAHSKPTVPVLRPYAFQFVSDVADAQRDLRNIRDKETASPTDVAFRPLDPARSWFTLDLGSEPANSHALVYKHEGGSHIVVVHFGDRIRLLGVPEGYSFHLPRAFRAELLVRKQVREVRIVEAATSPTLANPSANR